MVYRTHFNRLDHGVELPEPTLLFGNKYQRSVHNKKRNIYLSIKKTRFGSCESALGVQDEMYTDKLVSDMHKTCHEPMLASMGMQKAILTISVYSAARFIFWYLDSCVFI